jgi:hypothetical protein
MSCPAKTALTDNELNQTYSKGTVQGLLPGSPSPTSDREANGMLKSTAILQIIISLKGSGVIPKPITADADTFVKKQAQLLKNVQDEYCFYESRYKYSLEKLFDAIQAGYVNNTGDAQTAIKNYLQTNFNTYF